jgi:hypothetical protein
MNRKADMSSAPTEPSCEDRLSALSSSQKAFRCAATASTSTRHVGRRPLLLGRRTAARTEPHPIVAKEAFVSTPLPVAVSRYFQLDAARDVESIVALFAGDATVIDENETRRGTAEIRAWQRGPASKYTYATEMTGSSRFGPDRYVVDARLTGNFPGGTANLKFDFTIADEHITRLVIAP